MSLFRNMFNFRGRTGRIQYLINVLVSIQVMVAAVMVPWLLGLEDDLHWLSILLGAAVALGMISSSVRRLRDAGYDPLCLLVILLPVIGWYIVLFRLLMPENHSDWQLKEILYDLKFH